MQGTSHARARVVYQDGMKRIYLTLVAVLALGLTGCSPAQMQAASDVLAGISRGAAWLSSALDVADTGAKAYFARHPQQEAEGAVSGVLHKARLAAQALDAVLAVAESLKDPKLAEVKKAALEAYSKVRETLDAFGILDAKAPAGGAEGNGPAPEPFELPSADDIAERM